LKRIIITIGYGGDMGASNSTFTLELGSAKARCTLHLGDASLGVPWTWVLPCPGLPWTRCFQVQVCNPAHKGLFWPARGLGHTLKTSKRDWVLLPTKITDLGSGWAAGPNILGFGIIAILIDIFICIINILIIVLGMGKLDPKHFKRG